MSELKTTKLIPASGTDVTLGDSGDTFNIPAGVTLTNSGTASGFGGGAIAQIAFTVFDTAYTLTPGTTLTEVNTGNRVTITPTSTSNFLILECFIPINFTTTTDCRNYAWYDVTGSAVFGPSTVTTGSNRIKAATGFRGAGVDGNDCDFAYVRSMAACPRTTSSVFTPQFRSESGVYYINYSNSDGSDWQYNAPSLMTATEITIT